MIDSNDLAQIPHQHTLKCIGERSFSAPQSIDFPSSGSIVPQTYSKSATDPLTMMCQWIHGLANPDVDTGADEEDQHDIDGDIPMKLLSPTARKILIHCADGYTESTLLGMAYFMYAEQIPLHEAWLRLHCEKGRNFFAYPSDVSLLSSIQARLVPALPLTKQIQPGNGATQPAWLSRMDGSLPSRILPYMYLGNLGHANNPELLRAMGIQQVLSVGEPVNWSKAQLQSWGSTNILYVDRVQDNGVDSLMKEFEACLNFIGELSLSSPLLEKCADARCSQRQICFHSNTSTLPCWCFAIRHNMHSRSDGVSRALTSACVLLRASAEVERHHTASPAFCIRVAEMGRGVSAK